MIRKDKQIEELIWREARSPCPAIDSNSLNRIVWCRFYSHPDCRKECALYHNNKVVRLKT